MSSSQKQKKIISTTIKNKKKDKDDKIATNITRKDKLKLLKLDENLSKEKIDDDVLDNIYSEFNKLQNNNNDNDNNNNNCQNKKINNKKIDKNSPKYKLTLDFINDLMVQMGKERIKNLTEFKDIKRDDLLTDECNEIMERYLERFISTFGKTTIIYRTKNKVGAYILTLLKSTVSHIGYNFIPKQKFTTKKQNNLNVKISWRTYSIVE